MSSHLPVLTVDSIQKLCQKSTQASKACAMGARTRYHPDVVTKLCRMVLQLMVDNGKMQSSLDQIKTSLEEIRNAQSKKEEQNDVPD